MPDEKLPETTRLIDIADECAQRIAQEARRRNAEFILGDNIKWLRDIIFESHIRALEALAGVVEEEAAADRESEDDA